MMSIEMDRWLAGLQERQKNHGISPVNLALAAPDRLTAAEVGERDRVAAATGRTFNMVNAGWEDAKIRFQADTLHQNPVMEKWLRDAPENVSYALKYTTELQDLQQAAAQNQTAVQPAQKPAPRKPVQLQLESTEAYAAYLAENGVGGPSGEDIKRRFAAATERSRTSQEIVDLVDTLNEKNADDIRARLVPLHNKLAALQNDDISGIYGFLENMHRMVTRDLGTIALAAGGGAAAGAGVGAAFGGVGAVPGAILGGVKAGATAGIFETSREFERNLFIAELLMEKDEAGKYMDVPTAVAFGNVYGIVAGGIEAALTSVGLKISAIPAVRNSLSYLKTLTRPELKSALTAAARDKSIRAELMGSVVKPMLLGATAEGVEESLQEVSSIGIANLARQNASAKGKNLYFDERSHPGLFSLESLGQIAESGFEGAKVGLWFHALPGIAHTITIIGRASHARAYADGQIAVAKAAEPLKKEMAPERQKTLYETIGLTGNAFLPADAVLELQNKGVDVAGPMGWKMETLQEAARNGQEIEAAVAELHARLSLYTMSEVAMIMRPAPESMNAYEAGSLREIIEADTTAEREELQKQIAIADQIDAEMERLQQEAADAVNTNPGIAAQVASSTDSGTTQASAAAAPMQLLNRRAAAMVARGEGEAALDLVKNLHFTGVVLGEDGKYHVQMDGGTNTLLSSLYNDDESVRWVRGFKKIPADPVVLHGTDMTFAEVRQYANKKFGGREFHPVADEQIKQVRVSSEGIKETLSKRATKERLPILLQLPEVLGKTHIYRTEKTVGQKGLTKHGVAAAVLDGEPVVVRTVFKLARERGKFFWKFYDATIHHMKKDEGVPAPQDFLAADATGPILHTPSLPSTLYDWISRVKEEETRNGAGKKRFPDDRTILRQNEDTSTGSNARGATTLLSDGGYLVSLFEGADLSTLAHEFGHVFTLNMEQIVQEGRASRQTIEDLKILHDLCSYAVMDGRTCAAML